MKAEERRLEEARERSAHWCRWGLYLSERQWGTVREDDSPDGTAWEYPSNDILISIISNRGTETAPLHLLPTLWFRNTWSWDPGAPRPRLHEGVGRPGWATIEAEPLTLGRRWISREDIAGPPFTENDTNKQRRWGVPSSSAYVKDAVHEYVVGGRHDAVNGTCERFQQDPHWRDRIHFDEYVHGDEGRGIGASHQTGWTALVAKLIEQSGE